MVAFPTQLTSQIDAVNVLLGTIGEEPISSLEPPIEAVDAAVALSTINEIDLTVQAKGWWFNREYALPLTPNSSGNCQLPDQTLYLAKARWANASAVPCKVVERAKMLYDPINHTNVFTAPVVVDLVVRIPWDDMPEVVRRYITIRAAKQFQARQQGSVIVDKVTDEEIQAALGTVEQQEDANEQFNSITDSPAVQRVVRGAGVRRRPWS